MSVNNTMRLVKKVHPNSIILVKIGNFYNVYAKDAYILSYLFNYKIRLDKDGYKMCGFPITSLTKVIFELDELNVNYIILDRKDNYEVLSKEEFKNNQYEKVYSKSFTVINLKSRIEKISDYLVENAGKTDFIIKLKKVEEIIYES